MMMVVMMMRGRRAITAIRIRRVLGILIFITFIAWAVRWRGTVVAGWDSAALRSLTVAGLSLLAIGVLRARHSIWKRQAKGH